ncbi:MAG: hypothetical protein E6713_19375, partial [Sporomusaceae bacterium]|nr:hypothetical protein [Sporomusaceae bacterium]
SAGIAEPITAHRFWRWPLPDDRDWLSAVVDSPSCGPISQSGADAGSKLAHVERLGAYRCWVTGDDARTGNAGVGGKSTAVYAGRLAALGSRVTRGNRAASRLRTKAC